MCAHDTPRESGLLRALDANAFDRIYRLALGPAATELGTGPDSTPNLLGPVDFELGVITGNRSILPVDGVFGGPADGKVSVE